MTIILYYFEISTIAAVLLLTISEKVLYPILKRNVGYYDDIERKEEEELLKKAGIDIKGEEVV